MMTNSRKWALGISFAAMVGAAFWARELASWRPVVVAKVGFAPTQLKFSHDGKWLLLRDFASAQREGAILNLETHALDINVHRISHFEKDHGVQTFPHIWLDEPRLLAGKNLRDSTAFSASPSHIIYLKDLEFSDFDRMTFGWSQERHEIYGETIGKVWVWDWNSGQLKKRFSYATGSRQGAVFSPDGKSLLISECITTGRYSLRLYATADGKLLASTNRYAEIGGCSFSPDGKFVWLIEPAGSFGNPRKMSFHVIDASNFKPVWSAPCSGPVGWLPDGRLGIVQENGFEWRSSSGRLLERLPGPSATNNVPVRHVNDWTLSNDGHWIYSCEVTEIRRWRAR